MSTNIRLFSKLLLILLLTFQFTHAMANTGKAFSIRGTAALNGSELTTADTVKEGDIIKTGANSSVKIIMEDKTVLDIGENTRFQISKYSYNKEKPAESRSRFSLLKGTFRFISGLIAKNKPQNVQISAGTATIGIRGSFDTISFDGTTVTVDTSLGTATITFSNGETVTITRGNTGTLNVSTGQSSVKPTTTPDPVAQAAIAIANNPTDADAVAQALGNLSDVEAATVAIAAFINNAELLGVDDSAALSAAIGNAAAAIPGLAAALAYVGSALSPDNSQAIIDAITEAAPDQADAIQDAGDSGTDLADPPDTGDVGDTGATKGTKSTESSTGGAVGATEGFDPDAPVSGVQP